MKLINTYPTLTVIKLSYTCIWNAFMFKKFQVNIKMVRHYTLYNDYMWHFLQSCIDINVVIMIMHQRHLAFSISTQK